MTEGIEIQTTADLTARILDQWELKRKEALALQEEQKKKLKTAIQNEKELTGKLKAARSIGEKMQGEYLAIETRIQGEKKAMIETASIREQDVLSGKVTLAEFTKKGKSEKAIYEEAARETAEEMKQAMTAARAKNLEILKFEESLLETQVRIRLLLLSPAGILQKVLKDLSWFTEQEMGIFIQEVNSSRVALNAKKEEIMLVEKGMSLGSGHSWGPVTFEQAVKIQFSPILHEEAIPKLKAELKKYEGTDQLLNITYYWRSKEFGVTLIPKKKEIE